MSERCPRCGNTTLVVKKFTVGDPKTTVYDYFCPQCKMAETINCDEPEWRKAVARWRVTEQPTSKE